MVSLPVTLRKFRSTQWDQPVQEVGNPSLSYLYVFASSNGVPWHGFPSANSSRWIVGIDWVLCFVDGRYSKGKRDGKPSFLWLYLSKLGKTLGLWTAQTLILEVSFSVSGIIFWAFGVATLLVAVVYRSYWFLPSAAQVRSKGSFSTLPKVCSSVQLHRNLMQGEAVW
jgi:hypothetical protein